MLFFFLRGEKKEVEESVHDDASECKEIECVRLKRKGKQQGDGKQRDEKQEDDGKRLCRASRRPLPGWLL
jgi:hypothetical protein